MSIVLSIYPSHFKFNCCKPKVEIQKNDENKSKYHDPCDSHEKKSIEQYCDILWSRRLIATLHPMIMNCTSRTTPLEKISNCLWILELLKTPYNLFFKNDDIKYHKIKLQTN